MPLTLQLEGVALIQPAIHDLYAAGGSPTGAVLRALHAHLFERARDTLGARLCKPPRIRPDLAPTGRGPATLLQLAKTGLETWYIEIHLATLPGDAIEDLGAKGDQQLIIVPLSYGHGIERATQLKISPLKRQTNHVLRLNHIRIPGVLFRDILHAVDPRQIQQPLVPNFQPGPDIFGYRTVAFDHMLTGNRTYCNCARPMHNHMLAEAKELAPQYVAGSWPQQVVAMLKVATYADELCHLCLARKYSAEEAARRYGAGVETEYKKYVDQVMFDLGMDAKTAKAEIMQVLGLSRWVREAELFKAIRQLFPDQRVVREASPDWLGRLRLDIFLPELHLALEHQGEQHYQPVAAFGGDAAHVRLVERDALKRHLCKENGVEVVDIRFDAPISTAALRRRLQRYLAA